MDCHGHHAYFFVIQTGLFLETISFWHLVGQLNNFASMINFPLVQGRSNKPPGGGSTGRGGGWGSYSMILPHFLISLISMSTQMI